MSALDPERVAAALSAAVGGSVYGCYHLATLWLSGKPTTAKDYQRAFGNLLFAVLLGLVVAYYLAPAALKVIPWVSLRDVHAVGFCIGAFGWELLPVVFELVKKRAARIGEE